MATKTRRKRCSECKELKDEVLGRQRLCEDCESKLTYCTVCDEYADRCWGGGCRHVGWCDEVGYCGCGSDYVEAEYHRESFIELLRRFEPMQTEEWKWNGASHDVIHKPLLPEMLTLIEKNNFWTQWHGSMFGPFDLGLRYTRRRHGENVYLTLIDISSSEQEAWGEEAIEAMQLGMAWLTSLDDRSKEANKLTAKWIREFLASGKKG